jgi:hypothetical protein
MRWFTALPQVEQNFIVLEFTKMVLKARIELALLKKPGIEVNSGPRERY